MSNVWSRLQVGTSILRIFAPSRGRGCPACQPPPVARGAPGVPEVWGQVRPGPGAPTPKQFRCASRPQVEAAAGRSITSDFEHPIRVTKGALPNYDLMHILLPLADVLAGDRSRWWVNAEEAAAFFHPMRRKK